MPKLKLKYLLIIISVILISTGLYFFLFVYSSNSVEINDNGRNKFLAQKISSAFDSILQGENIKIITEVNDTGDNPANTSLLNESNEFKVSFSSQYYYDKNIEPNQFNKEFLKKVISHETMHILSIRSEQIKLTNPNDSINKYQFKILEKDCLPSYFSIYGCFNDNSYLSAFFNKFWTGDLKSKFDYIQDLESVEIAKLEKDKWDREFDNNFVSKNAKINIEEDIAESFSLWALNTDVSNLNEQQKNKINFFENYSELKELKDKINIALTEL